MLVSSLVLAQSVALGSTAYVRINQMGYLPGVSCRAYVMAGELPAHLPFSVYSSDGRNVFSGRSSANVKQWGRFAVASLDFSVPASGRYRIFVGGSVAAQSPEFRVDDAAHLYETGLSNALEFYQNQRDGANFIPSDLRTAGSHQNDRSAKVYAKPDIDDDDVLVHDLTPTGATTDAEGGWWDAGDYLKFVQTHSYTTALMLAGVRDFPAQMGASASSDFTAEAKFGLEWLLKMWHDDTRTLYYQVGIGTGNDDILSDHDIWRLPQVDDTYGGSDPASRYIRHRPVFVAGAAGAKISPNLAGRLAASFALGYQVFRSRNPVLAQSCLKAAAHVFELADTNPTGDLLTTAPFDFYPESEWRDDLELGATEMYFALREAGNAETAGLPHRDPGYYLGAAATWAHAYIAGPNDASDVLNLYDVSGLAHFELFRAIGHEHSNPTLSVSRTDLLADMKKALDNAAAIAEQDPFGFGFVWGSYDTATHGAGLSVEAKEYALLTGSTKYERYARHWAANILGANAWGASFIVGDGQVFPNCMQHQVANIAGSLDGTSPRLNGALVEGPNSEGATGFLDGMRPCPGKNNNTYAFFDGNGAVFIDNVESYATVEPAIDLTAASFLMFAWQMAGTPTALPISR